MKPPIPTPEPVPVQTLRRYGLNATADEVAEVYRQHGELVKALNGLLDSQDRADKQWIGLNMNDDRQRLAYEIVQEARIKARSILTTATPS